MLGKSSYLILLSSLLDLQLSISTSEFTSGEGWCPRVRARITPAASRRKPGPDSQARSRRQARHRPEHILPGHAVRRRPVRIQQKESPPAPESPHPSRRSCLPGWCFVRPFAPPPREDLEAHAPRESDMAVARTSVWPTPGIRDLQP